jgi:sterol desaturase/sphingolipid hydroxylase (fatty acid hydroxylase superfamily)
MLVWQAFAGVVAGHLAASFLQTALHRMFGHSHLGQNLFGGRISAQHVDGHHTLYSGGRLVLPQYSDEDKSLSVLYVVPAFLAIAPAFLVFPFTFAAGFGAGMLLSYAIHIFMHAQYHLSDALFREQEWFRRLRALHMVHHRQQDRNYAVIDLYWDKLMGTFARADAESGEHP